MKATFRQGILRSQTVTNTGAPCFLIPGSGNGRFISLNVSPDPTIITFSHGESNYTVEETSTVLDAWGPFQPTGETQYLFWDIDILFAKLTRGFTLIPPVVNNHAPTHPQPDQHWFDTHEKCMKVYNGNAWVVKLRVFAGMYDTSAVIIPRPLGSQAGLDEHCDSGYILLNDKLEPLRNGRGQFLTTASTIFVEHTNNIKRLPLQLETLVEFVRATEFIPKYSLISVIAGDNEVGLASYANTSRFIHGIVAEDLNIGEVCEFIPNGVIRDPEWYWPDAAIGKPLFCGLHGELTVIPPPYGLSTVVGTVLKHNSVNIDIQMPMLVGP